MVTPPTVSGVPAARHVRLLSPRAYAALWLALLLGTAAIALLPDVPVAAPNPRLAVAVATVAGAVGLALLHLGALRYGILGHPLDLFAGLAFGTLALANLVVRLAAPITGADLGQLETAAFLLLFSRTAAALLFLVGLIYPHAIIQPDERRRVGWRLGGTVALTLVLGGAAIAAAGHYGYLPDTVAPSTEEIVQGGTIIVDALPGQAPWLLVVNSAIGLLLLLSTLGYVTLARRLRDPHLASLALALTLLFFNQLHSLLFPPVAVDYVSTADGFRLAAYLLLLYSLVGRVGGEIRERAGQDERLRLSRDLHDGLAQQLSLLNLRLNRATDPDRAPASASRDLAAARRLVEAALLDARQAIRALRSGAVTWEEFSRTVSNFAEEFGQNHDVEVEVEASGQAPPLEAAFQVEVLRILHEACSNAVRHGAATRITVQLSAREEEVCLEVHDDGSGFDPDRRAPEAGVGLNSIQERLAPRGGTLRVCSAPGKGTAVHAHVPLRRASATRHP
jgi:signal transduction histidine kinase